MVRTLKYCAMHSGSVLALSWATALRSSLDLNLRKPWTSLYIGEVTHYALVLTVTPIGLGVV